MGEHYDLDAITEEIERAHDLAGEPHWECPWGGFAHLLHARATARPEDAYLTYVDDDHGVERRWTYGAVADAAARTAAYLRSLGVDRGDRVATLTGSLDYTIVVYLAAWCLGATAAPVNAAESLERKAFILDNSRARVLLARTEHLEEARALAAPREGLVLVDVAEPGAEARDVPNLQTEIAGVAPLDLAAAEATIGEEALLIYTSGTTGNPKGVVLNQYNLLCDADAMATWHGWGSDVRMMCVLPIHHVNGIVVTHVTPLYTGGSVVLVARFNSRTFWERVAAEAVQVVSVVPTLLEFLLEGAADAPEIARDVSSLQTIICGAGPLLVETVTRFEDRFGVPVTHGYGLSETTCYDCHLPPDLSHEEHRSWLADHGFPSIGCALPHQEMTIQRADGTKADPGERGEICIRGDVVCGGYYERPDANAEAFRGGWFHSGDEGFFLTDAAGREFLFITGRIKELIIRGGVNISPLEIDAVLNAHPDVRYGLAVPFDNRFYGEEIAAYVVPVEGTVPAEEEILAHCRGHLDFSKTPKVVVVGDEVPYTTTGKPKRLELRRLLADRLVGYRDVQFRREVG